MRRPERLPFAPGCLRSRRRRGRIELRGHDARRHGGGGAQPEAGGAGTASASRGCRCSGRKSPRQRRRASPGAEAPIPACQPPDPKNRPGRFGEEALRPPPVSVHRVQQPLRRLGIVARRLDQPAGMGGDHLAHARHRRRPRPPAPELRAHDRLGALHVDLADRDQHHGRRQLALHSKRARSAGSVVIRAVPLTRSASPAPGTRNSRATAGLATMSRSPSSRLLPRRSGRARVRSSSATMKPGSSPRGVACTPCGPRSPGWRRGRRR